MYNVRRITRQLVAFGTADVMVLVVNLLLLPIYTRVLSPREYGALALLIVCEAFLKVVFRWGLDTSFLRFFYDCPTEQDQRTLASTIAIFWLTVNGALFVLLLGSARPVSRLLFRADGLALPYGLMVLNTFAATFLFLPFSLLRIRERARLYASLTFVRSFGTVLFRLILVVGLRLSVTGIVLADVIVTAALFTVLGPMLWRMVSWTFSPVVLRRQLHYGLPRVPHGLLTQTTGMADRFLLGLYMPLSQVGLYQIASTVGSAIKFYTTAFETAWMPFAFDSMRRRDAQQLFGRMATYACAVLVFCALGLAGLGASLVVLMLPATYHDAAGVVPLIVLGMSIQSLMWFLATSLNIAKRTQFFPVITATSAATTVLASLILIPPYGMFGAAWSLIVSQTVASGMALYFAQRVYHIPYEGRRLAKLVTVGAIVYAAMVALPQPDAWRTVLLRSVLLGLFPLGLYLLRFLQPHESTQIREFVASLLDRGRTTEVPDLTVGRGSRGRPLGGSGL